MWARANWILQSFLREIAVEFCLKKNKSTTIIVTFTPENPEKLETYYYSDGNERSENQRSRRRITSLFGR
jgi:hypothetical protein